MTPPTYPPPPPRSPPITCAFFLAPEGWREAFAAPYASEVGTVSPQTPHWGLEYGEKVPRYRFSWDAFSDDFVARLASALEHNGDAASSRAHLTTKFARPRAELVKQHKDLIVSWFAQHEPSARAFYLRLRDAGLGPSMSWPATSHKAYVEYITRARTSKRFCEWATDLLIQFGDMDRRGDDEPDGFTPRFAILKVEAQPPDVRQPHDYQEEAWAALSEHLAATSARVPFQGLLVMPTGAGKTFTAVRWLTEHILAGGGRVLWLAHRTELLRHAAAEFHRVAHFAGAREQVRVRIVAGDYCRSTQINLEDDVVVASIASLARRTDKRDELLADPKLFVVVDEAHHAPSKSYRDLVEQLQRRKGFRLLGLTATPTRTLESERPQLRRMFARILHHVGLRTLIERGTLSRPRIVRVQTGIDVEKGVTEKDLAHLARFHDIAPEWAARIADATERNELIVDHYLEHQTTYGKTLVFAINVRHAAHLAARFREKGVKAEYVASYRPDLTDEDPGTPTEIIIEKFRDGQFDVLVNVAMVTEGVDVPDIQTAFLTRPTTSEILLRQMIGRALRGPQAGGTADAYLVSFEDHWTRFREWDSPFDLVPDLALLDVPASTEGAVDQHEPERELDSESAGDIPWEAFRALARDLRRLRGEPEAQRFEAVPAGWYVLEHEGENEDDELRHIVPVHVHQEACWEACFDQLWGTPTPKSWQALETWFADCDVPVPSTRDIELAYQLRRRGGDRPELIRLEGRDSNEPATIAQQIWDQDIGPRGQESLVKEAFGPIAKAVYGTVPAFSRAVDGALQRIKQGETPAPRKAVPIFQLGETRLLTGGPFHDLDALFPVVLKNGRALLGKKKLPHSGKLEWSTRPLKGWFGMAYYDRADPPGTGRIRMNRLLDSKEVPENVILYLFWHEYLHLYLQTGHTDAFRAHERKWPGYSDADAFLDTLNERFVVALDGKQDW